MNYKEQCVAIVKTHCSPSGKIMNDFDKQFNLIQRRSNMIFRIAFGWIAFVMLIIAIAIFGMVYLGLTLDPFEFARNVGELIYEFKQGFENGE